MKRYISPCLETILCVNGNIKSLRYHQRRFDKTRRLLYGDTSDISLDRYLNPPIDQNTKIRVIYNQDILKVEYHKVSPRNCKSFCLVESDLVYDFKYEKRDEIEILKKSFPMHDDIIIYSAGLLKDTSIANIAIQIKDVWYTPAKPLLEGTVRQRLIDDGFLKTADLSIDDLKNSSNFAIMNAIIGFKEIEKGVFDVASGIE